LTLRIGLIGCGFIATLHSRSLKALQAGGLIDAAVVATCDVDRSRAEAFARAHGADVATTDPDEVVAAADAVYVCTPTSTHRALLEAVAGAGRAVFCEKPLATTLGDAEAMAAAAAAVPNQVGLVLRTAPAYRALADLVHSGELGRPHAVVFRDDQYWPTQGQYGSTWRGDVDVCGGGTLLEHSIHDLDVLRWLLGDVESVTARTANFAGSPGVEDVAVATLSFGSGATASLTSVWHQVMSRPSTRYVEVLCEHGVVAVGDEYAGPLVVTTDAGPRTVHCGPPPELADLPVDERWRRTIEAYAPQALGFVTAVAEGRPPAPDLGVAVAAHRLADAVYRSAGTKGSPVALS
jgi:predicted dehydrogenase